MGGKKSKNANPKTKKGQPPTVTQIALVGSKGHGKKAFCQWIANKYNIQNVDTSKVFEVVCEFTLMVDNQPEVVKITISSGEDPTDRAKMARYGQTDVLLLMISVNSDPNPEKNHFAEYWEFYTQLCINKKDTSVIVVATKSDLRNEQNEKCIPKDGFKNLIDNHKFTMRDSATDHERSQFCIFECSNITGEGIEPILIESVRQRRSLASAKR